jgi:hypothetical protein
MFYFLKYTIMKKLFLFVLLLSLSGILKAQDLGQTSQGLSVVKNFVWDLPTWGFGNLTGVTGESQTGNGVVGKSNGGGVGVYGESAGFNAIRGIGRNKAHGAVVGIHEGGGIAIYGKTSDPNGSAIYADGKMTAKVVEILGGSDIAEHFKSSAPKTTLEAGTLMVADDKNQGEVIPSSIAYDKKVVGVVSGANGVKTGMTLRQEGTLEGEAVIAVAGRVYVKVSTLNGKIKTGDLLTSSNIAGYAMKATKKRKSNGAIIGKALTSLDAKEGLVLMLVNLQ